MVQIIKTLPLLSLIIYLSWNNSACFSQTSVINKIRLALFIDKGAHPGALLCKNIAAEKSFLTNYVTGENICNGCLKNIDVLFIPGGSGKREALSLTTEGQNKVKDFVHNGGIYLGVCAGCYLASCARPEYLGLFPMTTADKEHWRRGKAKLPIEFTHLGMEIFGVKQPDSEVIYHNGPVLKAFANYKNQIIPLCYFRGEIVAPKGKVGVMVNAPAMVLARYGYGLVLGISPHPEATADLATIELHAIHWLYDHRSAPGKPPDISEINSRQNPVDNLNKQALHSQTLANKTLASKTLSNEIYTTAENVFNNTTFSHYEHLHERADEQVQNNNGKYRVITDCSGFVSYLINSIAPKHYAAIQQMSNRSYLHANTYAKFFSCLPSDQVVDGWLKIDRLIDLRRGDIIAWQGNVNPSEQNKRHGSGHIMVVIDPPTKVHTASINGQIKYVEVFVLDSSSIEHFPPQFLPATYPQQYRDGIGKGMIRLILDDQNNIIGFWEGTFSHEKNKAINKPTFTNKIAFARLISNKD